MKLSSIVMLRDRSLNPYTPPVSWLQMTRGAVDVFKTSWKWIANDEHLIASRLAKRMPVLFDDGAKFGVSNRQGLLHPLQRDEEDIVKERWHAKDQEAYETNKLHRRHLDSYEGYRDVGGNWQEADTFPVCRAKPVH
jgi:hypothetical protein